jgi:1-acyl-sn-glycerol-3-phosphate acyltransferase
VEVTGIDNVPESTGGLVVSWHPNGLIDPGLILTTFPGRIVFGARHGLFKMPIFGVLIRALGTVPIYRPQDAAVSADDAGRRTANRQSIDALATAVAEGSYAALFPEGTSHDAPHFLELRSGAARLYYRALELTPAGAPPPVIVPVGLHYDAKQVFGSHALVAFQPPIELEPDLAAPLPEDATEEERRTRCARLTEEIDRALTAAVRPTASWELHRAMHRARSIMRAERSARAGAVLSRPDMEERVLGFSRLWEAYNARLETHPEQTRELTERVQQYDADLRAVGLKDRELDASPRLASPWLLGIMILQLLLVYVVLPPILLVGLAVNTPTALAILAFAKSVRKSYKDEASVKLLVGAVAFPLTWLVVAVLVAFGQLSLHLLFPEIPQAPLLTGTVTFLLGAAGALVALHYHRLSQETLRSVRVRFTRARRMKCMQTLRSERAAIFEQLSALAQGLDLPGSVAPDGRIVDAQTDGTRGS